MKRAIAIAVCAGFLLQPIAARSQLEFSQSWEPIGDQVNVTASPTSTATPLSWVTSGEPAPPVALVCNSGTARAYVAFGQAGLVATSRRPPEFGNTFGYPIAAGACTTLRVNGATTVAAVTQSGTTALAIQTGIGTPLGITIVAAPSGGLTWGGVAVTWGGVTIDGL